jgi:hypothetical protein
VPVAIVRRWTCEGGTVGDENDDDGDGGGGGGRDDVGAGARPREEDTWRRWCRVSNLVALVRAMVDVMLFLGEGVSRE